MRAHEFMNEDELNLLHAHVWHEHGLLYQWLCQELEHLIRQLAQPQAASPVLTTDAQPLSPVMEMRARSRPTRLPPEICGDMAQEPSTHEDVFVDEDWWDRDGDGTLLVMEPMVMHPDVLMRRCVKGLNAKANKRVPRDGGIRK